MGVIGKAIDRLPTWAQLIFGVLVGGLIGTGGGYLIARHGFLAFLSGFFNPIGLIVDFLISDL